MNFIYMNKELLVKMNVSDGKDSYCPASELIPAGSLASDSGFLSVLTISFIFDKFK